MSSPSNGWTLVGTVALVLFVDYFLYGATIPLTAHAPAGVKSEGELGSLYATYAASVLVVTPLFGYLGDRLGVRFMMLVGVAFAGAAALFFGLGRTYTELFVARLCQGAASAAVWTSGLAIVAERYRERRVEMIGYALTGSTAGLVLGPLAAGALYHRVGYEAAFLVVGGLVAVEAVCLLLFVPRAGDGHRAKVDLKLLLGNRALVVAALAVALAAFAWGIIEPLLPAQLDRRGVSGVTVGTMFTMSSIAYGCAAPLVGWASNRIAVKWVIVLGTVLTAATLPLLVVSDAPLLVGLMLCIVNVSFAFMLNPAAAELANATEAVGLSCYSTSYAIYNVVYSIGMLATSAIATGIGHALGMGGAFAAVSAVLAFAALILVALNRGGPHVRHR